MKGVIRSVMGMLLIINGKLENFLWVLVGKL